MGLGDKIGIKFLIPINNKGVTFVSVLTSFVKHFRQPGCEPQTGNHKPDSTFLEALKFPMVRFVSSLLTVMVKLRGTYYLEEQEVLTIPVFVLQSPLPLLLSTTRSAFFVFSNGLVKISTRSMHPPQSKDYLCSQMSVLGRPYNKWKNIVFVS